MSRILLVCPWFYPAWKSGGTALAAYNTAKVYVKLGHRVDVFTTRENGHEVMSFKGKIVHQEINVRYFSYLPFYKGAAWSPALLFTLCRKARNYDVICINGVRNAYELLLLLMHRVGLLNAKIFVTPHAAWRKDWIEEIGNSFLVRLYQRVITRLTRQVICQYLSEEEKRDSPKIYDSQIIIPNYINAIKVCNSERNQSYYLMLCRVHPQKAIERAISLIRDNKTKILHIYGPVDDHKYYELLVDRIESLGLSERIFFMGSYNNDELALILSKYSAIVFSSHVEGVSMAMLEALSSGLPVIYSEGVGNRDILAKYMPETRVVNWEHTVQIVKAVDARWKDFSSTSMKVFENEYSERAIMEKWKRHIS